jgi:hypothetical protein
MNAMEEKLVAAMSGAGIPCKTAREAWTRSRWGSVLLGYVLAMKGLSSEEGRAASGAMRDHALASFDASLGAQVKPVVALLERAASGTLDAKGMNRVAFDLAGAKDENVLARRPAVGALADFVQHCVEGQTEFAAGSFGKAFDRGVAAGRALASAISFARHQREPTPDERAAVAIALADAVRAALPEPPAAGETEKHAAPARRARARKQVIRKK